MDNKIKENEIKVQSEFVKKLDNFWYYHKWKAIIAAFFVIVFGICVYSCITRPEYDITVVYAGPLTSTDKNVPNINNDMSEIMPDELGNNGANVLILSIFNEEQAKNLATARAKEYISQQKKAGVVFTPESEAKERARIINDELARLNSATHDGYSSLGSYLGMGNYTVYLLDPEAYEYYATKNEPFVPLAEIYGDNIPSTAANEYAIRLGDTEFYKTHKNGISKLPADTLVCLRVEPVIRGCSGQSSPEKYEESIKMFKEIAK